MRYLLYSHDGLGLGHTRRHVAIAGAIIDLEPDASVLMVTGTDDIHGLGVSPQVEVLKIPGLRKVANGRYIARRLALEDREIIGLRSKLIAAAVAGFRPDVMLVDKHPFGPGGELRRALTALRAHGGRAVLGLRDILDDRATVLGEWPAGFQRRVAAAYDRVFVYGSRAVFDPMAEYDFPPAFSQRAQFCGYVVNAAQKVIRPQIWQRDGRRAVLGCAGGGEDGFGLLENFIRASAGAPWRGIAVTGPMAGLREQEELRRLASHAEVECHTFLPDMPRIFSNVDAIVCMGGYNTLAEAATEGVPTVCVPRTQPRLEQKIRAEAFERLGILRTILPDGLRPEAVRAGVEEVLGWDRSALRQQARRHLEFDGAERAARQLIELALPRITRPLPLAA